MGRQSITTRQQREQLAKLTELVARRARDEVEIRERSRQRLAEAKREYERQRDDAASEFEREHVALAASFKEAREAVYFQYESAGQSLLQEEQRFWSEAALQLDESLDDAKTLYQTRIKQITDSFHEKEQVPRRELSQFRKRCDWCSGELDSLYQEANKVLRRRRVNVGEPLPPTDPPPGMSTQEYVARVTAGLESSRAQLAKLAGLPAARFVDDGWPILIFVFASAALAYPIWAAFRQFGWTAVVALAFITPLLLAIVIRQAALGLARRQTLRLLPAFQQTVASARGDLGGAVQTALSETDRAHKHLVDLSERQLVAAKADYEKTNDKVNKRHEARTQKARADFDDRRRNAETSFERQLAQLDDKFPPKLRQLEHDFERQLAELGRGFRSRCAALRDEFEREWNLLASEWRAGVNEFEGLVERMNGYCAALFPKWDEARGKTRPAEWSDSGVPALRFGDYQFDMAQLPGGLPVDPDLAIERSRHALPALLSFPECPSLLLEAEGEGRDEAIRAIQNVMLRLLTTFSPGKVRFTILDPVGLGQNFSAFMHLADYDERLVANRIWTESAHINQRLTDLTEHMENVIQKYLRNEFASIQEYNEHAGEVAEPFQILVVANFPANFSEEAARRLVSIASSGARCGVYTLISADMKLKLPRNFDLADLEREAATIEWDAAQGRFAWKEPELRALPLEVESPPRDELFTEIVREVGRNAKDASRVEVPFEMIVPEADHWWASDSRAEIEVPLGRAGAKKLQYMRLGKGTSQHVLISGKTGSGKSTLLNAIITSLAVHYSPEELQFYLIDFKKGVEFKAYATYRLPHARVIAIESEREFGMSVLERLDLELKRRGDLFRKFGVQDLKGYRNADPDSTLPRVLLVIDEFQEFFTTDDRIAHDASLLLDRLVRQGRAFGIHVLLGSQTLAGAYSLARSTIGQMAVRIALQCSEADSHLILSEDNTAARLLSRPGEAIYNDANGLFEGNHPFQVVWLSDDQREDYLTRIAILAQQRKVAGEPPTVFEGNAAADPVENHLLRAVVEAKGTVVAGSPAAVSPRAWLGAAVAIKDPTDVSFRRQGGSNLVIVGQQEELALGVLANAAISLAAQRPVRAESLAEQENSASGDEEPGSGGTSGDEVRGIYVLDGTRPESPESGFWQRLNRQIDLGANVVAPRDAVRQVNRLAEEVERRLAEGETLAEPVFLVIYNLAKFRDLRKSEDFGLSGFDDEGPANGGKSLAKVLREGPAVGVHTLVWCDSYNNLQRWFERSTLRDLEMRVLFQMNATDSSNLMDSPAASKLGSHMAIFYSEEHGHAEKFRPYGMPNKSWLSWVAGERVATS